MFRGRDFPELAPRKDNCTGGRGDPTLNSISTASAVTAEPKQGLQLVPAEPCRAGVAPAVKAPAASGATETHRECDLSHIQYFVSLPGKTNHWFTYKHCSTLAGKRVLYAPVFSLRMM